MNEPSIDSSPETLRAETIVRLRHSTESISVSRPGNAREAFWRPFLENSERDEHLEWSADAFEGRIRSVFSRALKSYFESIASPTIITPDGQRRAAAAAAIVIQTHIRGYSSVELGLMLEPINKVVELFDGNFEYFVAFLGMYIPIAFQRSLSGGGWDDEGWDTVAGQLVCDVTAAPSLVAAFGAASYPQRAPVPASTTAADKARWVWMLSNTSLVVPTLVAGFYLYVVLSHSHEREATIDKAYQELIRVQSDLIRSPFTRTEKSAAQTPVDSASPSPVPTPSTTPHI
jgi:hypothetical protein